MDKELAGLSATLAQADIRFGAVLIENEPSGRLLMERLATATGGRVFLRSSASSAELFDWALAGCPSPARLVSIKAEGAADEDVFTSTAWAPGRALHIFGRRKNAGSMRLTVAFERDGRIESREWNLTLKNDLDDLFVGRLWAQRKLDQLRGAGNRVLVGKQIVALSQEWTLLSPLTAFLVLESEAEYPQYGITRPIRAHPILETRRPAVVEQPLPAEAIAALKNLPKTRRSREPRSTTPDDFQQALAGARKALKNRAPNRALEILGSVFNSPLSAETAEFAMSSESRGSEMLARGDLLRSLGPERGWFDRRRMIGFPTATTDVVGQLLHGYRSAGLKDSPWRGALGKQAQPPAVEMTVQNFIDWFEGISGIPVIVDKRTLLEEGVALDQPVSLRGIHLMSLDNLLTHVLNPVQLTTVVDDDALLITTASKAADRLDTRLYPVADLLLTAPATDFSQLANPGLDRKLLAKRRLNEKIDRRLSVDFVLTPLQDVVDFLNEKLDGNIVLDRRTLLEENILLDSQITLKMDKVPARRILKRLCEPLQLETVLENEAVVITTQAKAADKLEIRLHSAVGIVFELPSELARKRPANPARMRGFGGFGGGGMGMGGMGGMMGGMGGGMGGGGFGFAGGGIGGGGTGVAAGMAAPGNASSSSGNAVSQSAADGDVEPISDVSLNVVDKKEIAAEPAEDDLDDSNFPWNPRPFNPSLGRGPFFVSDGLPRDTGRAWDNPEYSSRATISLIESTVQPQSWEAMSGPGTTMFFKHSLVFALRQTQSVHDEIEELLERVRELPNAYGDQTGWRPARVPEIGPNDVDHWDTRLLMMLIESVVQPESWEAMSGPGTMSPIRPKLALAIRQTQAAHNEIRDLLTLLRRAKYLVRQGRTWKSDGLLEGPWFAAGLAITDLPPGPKQSELPEPEAEELKALAVLNEPIAGAQTWRTVPAAGRASQSTILRQTAAQSAFEFEGRLARVAGDDAAVAYPGITLVEHGSWGEALRRIVDGRLPWLPHRNRRELAQMFIVRVAAENEQTVQLRLSLPAATPGNEILLTVSRKNGLPILWESRLGSETALRLRFEDLGQAGGRPIWKTIIAEDRSGREIERWELAEFAELKEEIPPLNSGWKDYVSVDVRNPARGAAPSVIGALQAIRTRNWNAADRELTLALSAQPGQPLLLLLQAWSLAQREGTYDPQIVALLKEVARSGSTELMQPITDRSIAPLPDRGLYEASLHQEQPVAARPAADWENLTRGGPARRPAGRRARALENGDRNRRPARRRCRTRAAPGGARVRHPPRGRSAGPRRCSGRAARNRARRNRHIGRNAVSTGCAGRSVETHARGPGPSRGHERTSAQTASPPGRYGIGSRPLADAARRHRLPARRFSSAPRVGGDHRERACRPTAGRIGGNSGGGSQRSVVENGAHVAPGRTLRFAFECRCCRRDRLETLSSETTAGGANGMAVPATGRRPPARPAD